MNDESIEYKNSKGGSIEVKDYASNNNNVGGNGGGAFVQFRNSLSQSH